MTEDDERALYVAAFQQVSEASYLTTLEASEMLLEYVGGFVLPRAASNVRHAQIHSNLLFALLENVDRKRVGVYGPQMRLRVAPSRFGAVANYFPDLMLTREGGGGDTMYFSAPCMLIEIANDETWRVDTVLKAQEYRALPSLEAYVIVDCRSRTVALHQRKGNGWRYEVVVASVRLPTVGVTLALNEIYEDTELSGPATFN